MKSQGVLRAGGGIIPARWTLLGLRLGLGSLFLQSAYAKLTTVGGWTAAGYLSKATGPLAGWFQNMAGSAAVDWLVICGEF